MDGRGHPGWNAKTKGIALARVYTGPVSIVPLLSTTLNTGLGEEGRTSRNATTYM